MKTPASPAKPENSAHVSSRRLNTGRSIIVSVIFLTSLVPTVFIALYLNEPSLKLAVYHTLAKAGSLVGGMLLIWQFLLGFRGALSRLFRDLNWIVDLHKKLGQFGIPIILLHPLFITLYYLETAEMNLWNLNMDSFISQYALLGIIMLALITLIVFISSFLKPKMGFYHWFYTHLSSYLIPPLLFIHSFALGSTLSSSQLLRSYWWFWTGIAGVFYIYRIAHKLGLFARRYKVTSHREVAKDVTQVNFIPHRTGLKPEYGQFVYLRKGPLRNAHPYTVSDFKKDTGLLAVSSKAQGPQSRAMQRVNRDEEFLIDGPYGIFTRVAMADDLPLIMIAGGIGITPFRRVYHKLEEQRDREAYLFYGCEFADEIVYKKELDGLEHVKVVYVLNQEPDYEGEQGFVTTQVIRKYIDQELSCYQFLLCGPPVMIQKLEESLIREGIPEERIQHELFSH